MKQTYSIKSSITLPKGLEKDLKKLAKKEHRTLSGVMQEAARYYLNIRTWESLQKEVSILASQKGIRSEDDVDKLIHELRSES